MSHYLADLIIILQTAGWMLATFALPLVLWAVCCAAIKSVSPRSWQMRGLKKGRNL